MRILERDLGYALISAVDSLIKSVTLVIYAENTSSAGYKFAVLKCCTCLEYELAACIDACDLVTLLIALGISA